MVIRSALVALVLAGCTASTPRSGYYTDDGRLVYMTPTRMDVDGCREREVGPDHLWRCVDDD